MHWPAGKRQQLIVITESGNYAKQEAKADRIDRNRADQHQDAKRERTNGIDKYVEGIDIESVFKLLLCNKVEQTVLQYHRRNGE